jgi:nucleoside-diphosphate-sugar epimerase
MEQAILGATGDVGGLLLQELRNRDLEVTALSRNVPENDSRIEGVKYLPADAENLDSLVTATRGVDVLYSTIAVPYGTESWQQSWPVIMRNIIDAARSNNFKLVFLDNIYMYGRVEGPITEETPIHPASKKGEVRTKIAGMLLDAMAAGDVNAVIGRSADFYGPDTRMSRNFFEGTLNDGVAAWKGKTDVLCTWNYTLDNAKALAVLGNDTRAEGQVWHLPAAPAMRGAEFIKLAGSILGKELKTVLIPNAEPGSREAFKAQMPEIYEMLYQYEYDLDFNSDKFQKTFGIKPTSYEDGFRYVYRLLQQRADSQK